MSKIFTQTRNIERELRILGKKFATNINYKNPDYYVSFRCGCLWCEKGRILKVNHRLGLSGFIRSRQHIAQGELAYSIQAFQDGDIVVG